MEKVKEYAKEIGIDLITFLNIENMNKMDLILPRNKQYFVNFKEDFTFLENKKSVISIAIAYTKQKDTTFHEYYGDISITSYGEDYHTVLNAKMNKLIDFLKQYSDDVIGYVDTGPLDNRMAAKLSNMGTYGKNTMLITEEFGSLVYLGTILTDYPFHENKIEIKNPCLNCNLCEIACPTNVLKDYKLNPELCLSYLTQIQEVDSSLFNKFNLIYGCDICQNVCPKNKDQDYLNEALLKQSIERINLEEFLNLSNKSYKRKYGNLAFSWRKYNIIKRNVYIRFAKYPNALKILENQNPEEKYLQDALNYSINKIREKNND